LHRPNDIRILSHAEIVVGTPDGDFPPFVALPAECFRKSVSYTLHIDENPVALFLLYPLNRFGEEPVIARRLARCFPCMSLAFEAVVF
jgi:hypothetical protein